MLGSASGSLPNYPGHPPAAPGGLVSLVPDLVLGPRKPLDIGELQQPGRRGTTRFFGTGSRVPMDWAASAIKPGRRSLNRTSMDGRRARDALKDPSHAKSDDVGTHWCSGCGRLKGRCVVGAGVVGTIFDDERTDARETPAKRRPAGATHRHLGIHRPTCRHALRANSQLCHSRRAPG